MPDTPIITGLKLPVPRRNNNGDVDLPLEGGHRVVPAEFADNSLIGVPRDKVLNFLGVDDEVETVLVSILIRELKDAGQSGRTLAEAADNVNGLRDTLIAAEYSVVRTL